MAAIKDEFSTSLSGHSAQDVAFLRLADYAVCIILKQPLKKWQTMRFSFSVDEEQLPDKILRLFYLTISTNIAKLEKRLSINAECLSMFPLNINTDSRCH